MVRAGRAASDFLGRPDDECWRLGRCPLGVRKVGSLPRLLIRRTPNVRLLDTPSRLRISILFIRSAKP
jgi:hypothetical protein